MKDHKMNEMELEAVAGGIQTAVIGGDAGLVLDNSVNNSGNVTTVTAVDASTTIADSFNQTDYTSIWSW